MQEEIQQARMSETAKKCYEKPSLTLVQLFADMVLQGSDCKFANEAPICSNPSYM